MIIKPVCNFEPIYEWTSFQGIRGSELSRLRNWASIKKRLPKDILALFIGCKMNFPYDDDFKVQNNTGQRFIVRYNNQILPFYAKWKNDKSIKNYNVGNIKMGEEFVRLYYMTDTSWEYEAEAAKQFTDLYEMFGSYQFECSESLLACDQMEVCVIED